MIVLALIEPRKGKYRNCYVIHDKPKGGSYQAFLIVAYDVAAGTELTWRYNRGHRPNKWWNYEAGSAVPRRQEDKVGRIARKLIRVMLVNKIWPFINRTRHWYANHVESRIDAANMLRGNG
jgi:hypothetical protein